MKQALKVFSSYTIFIPLMHKHIFQLDCYYILKSSYLEKIEDYFCTFGNMSGASSTLKTIEPEDLMLLGQCQSDFFIFTSQACNYHYQYGYYH